MIEKDDLSVIAALSHLRLNPDVIDKFKSQLNSVLDYVDQLNELNEILKKENIQPDISCCEPEAVTLREDKPFEQKQGYLFQKGSLSVSAQQYFLVPKVIDHS